MGKVVEIGECEEFKSDGRVEELPDPMERGGMTSMCG